jgi:hypothetical protein
VPVWTAEDGEAGAVQAVQCGGAGAGGGSADVSVWNVSATGGGAVRDPAVQDVSGTEGSMSEWQPIETAPKDGTAVLLFDRTNKDSPDGSGIDFGFYYNDAVRWLWACDGCEAKPSHWMPLPEPPK